MGGCGCVCDILITYTDYYLTYQVSHSHFTGVLPSLFNLVLLQAYHRLHPTLILNSVKPQLCTVAHMELHNFTGLGQPDTEPYKEY